ncbi:MAG: DsrE family protein [Ignavibacteria bacterium]|nr:DsrE family protein [Ignavibacteria bacterium]
MKTFLLCIPLVLLVTFVAASQNTPATRPGMMVDSVGLEQMFSKAQFPLLKGTGWSGAFPVENPAEIPDPAHEYKLLFEIIHANPDSTSGEINYSLDEMARILNLHVASGIPASRLKVVIAIHGPGIELATTDDAYRARHAIPNPNIDMIRQMKEKAGATFIVCGQAMAFFTTTRDELLPGMQVTYSTQTTLSDYQSRGYVKYTIIPER